MIQQQKRTLFDAFEAMTFDADSACPAMGYVGLGAVKGLKRVSLSASSSAHPC